MCVCTCVRGCVRAWVALHDVHTTTHTHTLTHTHTHYHTFRDYVYRLSVHQLTTSTTSQLQLFSRSRYSTTFLCPFQAAANTGVHLCWKQQQHTYIIVYAGTSLQPVTTKESLHILRMYNSCCLLLAGCIVVATGCLIVLLN